MNYYLIETDWDARLNSPWDSIWPQNLPHGALDCLYASIPLTAVWRSPDVLLEKGTKRPDVYRFVLHYAVTELIRDILANIIKEEAEFLPLVIPNFGSLYLIHPLWPIDFDDRAEVTNNSVSKNITVVHKYSFIIDPAQYDGTRHLFRIRQPKGSAARDAGYTLDTLIASERIKQAAEEAQVRGVVFKHICSV